MSRFQGAELDHLNIDPREPFAWSDCPFCGRVIVLGVRKGTRNVSLAHHAETGPDGSVILGCEPFSQVTAVNPLDFLRLCKSAGKRWTQETPG